jgi:hypothetical protein
MSGSSDQLIEISFPSQTQSPEVEPVTKPQPPTHWAFLGFFILVVVFNLCLNAQVLTVGLAYFYNPVWWKAHVWLVRSYSGLSLILLVWAYRVALPRRVRGLIPIPKLGATNKDG